MDSPTGSERPRSKRLFARFAIGLERAWDEYRKRSFDEPATDFRIVPFIGHGADGEAVVRGRVVDDPVPPEAVEGERVWNAVRRNVARFRTDELPDVPLRVQVGDAEVSTRTDEEGYFDLNVEADLGSADAPWTTGEVRLAEPYRGIETPHDTVHRLRVPGEHADFAVISDVDDTLLQSGASTAFGMFRHTVAGSALTRKPVPRAPALYRALAAGGPGGASNPFFYVSSSAWNLHGFLVAFLRHHDFPPGPLMLRDLLGTDPTRTHSTMKRRHIEEVLDVHRDLPAVLIGDSGQHDPRIYASIVDDYPDRIESVYIRDVEAADDDGVRDVAADYGVTADVPFVLATGSTAIAEHAADLGLLTESDVQAVREAPEATRRPSS